MNSILIDEDVYELRINSEPSQVRKSVRDLLDYIGGCAPASKALDDLRLIFSELLYNAVIHGNNKDIEKRVHVQLKAQTGRLFVCIEDEGCGYDYNQLIKHAHSDEALMDENGRGMVLVCALTENLTFNETGNQVCFEMRL